jgi:hypothetical protein
MIRPRFLLLAVALIVPACGDARALGRLFTTEAQRYQLEHPDTSPSKPQPGRNEEPVLLNGFVQNEQGRKTLWINGGMRDNASQSPRPGRVIVDANGRRVALKPGQTLDTRHHAVRDVFDPPAAVVTIEDAPAASSPAPIPAGNAP